MAGQQELDTLREENGKLKEELKKMQSNKGAEADGLDMLEMSCKIASLERELVESRNKPDHAAELESLKSDLDKLTDEKNAQASKIDTLKQKCDESKRAAQSYREKLEVIEYDHQAATEREAESRQTVTELTQKLEVANNKLAELDKRAKDEEQEKVKALNEMEKASASLNHTNEKLESSDKELEALNKKLSKARFEHQQESQCLQAELAQLRLQQQSYQSNSDQLSGMKKQIEELESQKKIMAKTIEQKEFEVQNLMAEKAQQLEEVKKLNAKIELDKALILQLTRELNEGKHNIEEIEKQHKITMDGLNRQLQSASTQRAADNAKIASLTSMQSLVGDTEQLRSVIRDKEEQIAIDAQTKKAQKDQLDQVNARIAVLEAEKKTMTTELNVKSALETQLKLQVQEGEAKFEKQAQKIKGYETSLYTLQADLRKKTAEVDTLVADAKKTNQEDLVPRVELMKVKDQVIRAEQQLALQSQNIAQLTKQMNAVSKEKRELQNQHDALIIECESIKAKAQQEPVKELAAQDAAVHASSNADKNDAPKGGKRNTRKSDIKSSEMQPKAKMAVPKEPAQEKAIEEEPPIKKVKVNFDQTALIGAKTKASLLRNLNSAEKPQAPPVASKPLPKAKTAAMAKADAAAAAETVNGRSRRKASIDARDNMLARTMQYLSPMSKTLGLHGWDFEDKRRMERKAEIASQSLKKKDMKQEETPELHEEVQSSPEPEPKKAKGRQGRKAGAGSLGVKKEEPKPAPKAIEVPKEDQVKEPPKGKGSKKRTFKQAEPAPPLKTDAPLTRATRRSGRKW